jgi:eukaryotic-like serine/threonine-protein kinase
VSELIGRRISHYRIDGLLGAGGMGAVYRAHDERLQRDLALKVLLDESLADATARARLVREAQMASSLNHPHIAHVYEVGDEGEHVFIAMELVEGRTLRDVIPTGGLPAETLLRYAQQIADALGHAHDRGVIHRDLKSTNIMITPAGWVKVLDFGLAKRLVTQEDETLPPDLALTASGIVLGTPTHLPPEVLLGAAADARSDIWALGVVLYEMASGKVPFHGSSMVELAQEIRDGTPAPLSARVPVGIRAVIARCLAKDPNQRYRQGNEVRAAIESLLEATTGKRSGGPSRRAWAIGTGVAALVVAAVVTFVPGLRERLAGGADRPRIGSLAVLPLANMSGDPAQEYFADGMTEELITDLAPIRALKVISRTSVMRFKNSQQSLREIARALGVDAIVEGSVQRAGDRVRITAQLIEASSDHHLWARSYERDFRDVLTLQSEVARDIAHEIQLQISPQVSERLASHRPINPEAYELYLKGRFEWNQLADPHVRKAIEYFERAQAIDPGDARYSSGLADAYLLLVQVTGSLPAREGMAKVKDYARQALTADEHSAEAHTSMAAALLFGDWNPREAEKHVLRAIELNPGYSTAHLVYSTLLAGDVRFDEAIEQDRRALELDPFSLIINWNASSTLYLAGRYDMALVQMRRTIEMFPESPLAHGSLLRIYEQKGDYPAALDVLEKFLPEADGGKALAAKVRSAYATSGAAGYWRASLDYRLGSPDASPGVLAMFYTRLGDHKRAMDYLERAYQEHSGDMVFIRAEPCYAPLRDEPRFRALVRRIGLGT